MGDAIQLVRDVEEDCSFGCSIFDDQELVLIKVTNGPLRGLAWGLGTNGPLQGLAWGLGTNGPLRGLAWGLDTNGSLRGHVF